MAVLNTAALLRDLTAEIAATRPAEPTDGTIDGVAPAVVARPATAEQVATALAIAARLGAAVIPVGGGSKLGLGNPPRRADVLLRLDALDAFGNYSPPDLTLTCAAGVRWRALQVRTQSERQQVPLDPPFADRATVGGVLATNSFGPSRIGYGAARDHVIGLTIANVDGTLTKSGGKVVKNVAGYDLNKLYIGSLGTLGVIVEVTWKLLPLPLVSRTLVAAFRDPAAATDVTLAAIRAGLQPRAAQVLNPFAGRSILPDGLAGDSGSSSAPGPSAGAAACWLAIRYSGREERVRRQIADTRQHTESHAPLALTELTEQADANLWQSIEAWPERSTPEQPGVRCKIAVRPTDLPDLWRALGPAELGHLELCGQAGTGLVWLEGDPAFNNAAAESLLALRNWAAARGGSLVLEAAPPDLKSGFDAWGHPGDGLPIMRRLKDLLDPAGTLNPGRFVAGI